MLRATSATFSVGTAAVAANRSIDISGTLLTTRSAVLTVTARPVNSSFREPSLDDLGRVAFTADILVDPTVFVTTQGVFTGPDPVAIASSCLASPAAVRLCHARPQWGRNPGPEHRAAVRRENPVGHGTSSTKLFPQLLPAL